MRHLALATALVALAATPAQAFVSDYQIGFGPHVGSGQISNGADVRHTSGYSLSLERHWPVGGGFYLAPRFEVANSFLSTRDEDAGTKSIATYDNRFVAGGLTVSHGVGNDGTFAQGAYVSAVAGRGYSKLAVDESTDRTFKQNLYGKISGNYYAGEVGAWIPLQGNFGLNLAFLGSLYEASQGDATGTFEGDEVNADGQLGLVKGEYEKGSLDRNVTMRTYAAKIGLSLGF